MPRKRKVGIRKVNERVLIFCEGEKTEPNYFNSLIRECDFPGRLIEVRVIKINKNTLRELVIEAKKYRPSSTDHFWVVADKDGYTKHPESFDKARANNINIAFSSISFEVWILLHYEFTTREFAKSDDVIRYIKHKHDEYEKNDEKIYKKVSQYTDNAIQNAIRLRKYIKSANPDIAVYLMNPYTNVDELVLKIKACHKKYCKIDT